MALYLKQREASRSGVSPAATAAEEAKRKDGTQYKEAKAAILDTMHQPPEAGSPGQPHRIRRSGVSVGHYKGSQECPVVGEQPCE